MSLASGRRGPSPVGTGAGTAARTRGRAFLAARGLREDTLVIFTSDHGTTLGEHGFDNKHTWYDSSWRVPLVLSRPGILPAGARRGFALWSDIAATVLAAAAIKERTVQGFDLAGPAARGEDDRRHHAVGTLCDTCAVATRRWKLAYWFRDAVGRLFDRRADPGERHDLWDEPAHRELRDGLLAALLTWQAAAGQDLAGLEQCSEGGGPVARRTAAYLGGLPGTAADEALERAVDWLTG